MYLSAKHNDISALTEGTCWPFLRIIDLSGNNISQVWFIFLTVNKSSFVVSSSFRINNLKNLVFRICGHV